MEKTILEWLSELPSPYREEAIKNAEAYDIINASPGRIGIMKIISLYSAIAVAFLWSGTEQGTRYWIDVQRKHCPR